MGPVRLTVGLALESDEDQVVELMRRQVEETVPHLGFDDYIARKSWFRYLDDAYPTIFVVRRGREIVGYSICLLNDYGFTTGQYVLMEVVYIAPEHRGSWAAPMLVKEFFRWQDVTGAREAILGMSNGFSPERNARFFERMGAERVGYQFKRKAV